jgi:hypothetical protein
MPAAMSVLPPGVTWTPRYAVAGDRLLVLIDRSDGGRDRLSFDEATGRLIHDPTAPLAAPGDPPTVAEVPEDADPLDELAFQALVAERRVDLLYLWASRLCRVGEATDAALRDALGVPLEPPPLVARSVEVRGGDIPTVSFVLRPETFDRATFEEAFGAGNRLPQVHPGDDIAVAAPAVAITGAAWRCTAFTRYASGREPGPTADVRSVVLRLDPAG